MVFFHYITASCQLPAAKDEPKGKPPVDASKQKPKKVLLNSAENLYTEIRDMNFSAVGPVLSREAKRITAEYEVLKGLNFNYIQFSSSFFAFQSLKTFETVISKFQMDLLAIFYHF